MKIRRLLMFWGLATREILLNWVKALGIEGWFQHILGEGDFLGSTGM